MFCGLFKILWVLVINLVTNFVTMYILENILGEIFKIPDIKLFTYFKEVKF